MTMIGNTVSHYKILEKLGEGGMGVVYKAEDTLLKRTVALKFLPPTLTFDDEARQRFIHEAQAASALDHPAISAIHEIATADDGQMFIVMAYYEGESLKKKIEDGGLKIENGIDIAIQIAEGLARAHEAGIVHRDIKPANIFITTHNEVKILDFGLAKLTGQTILTKTGSTLGTAAYMSPEQAKGEAVDHRTDIWSLGVVLYEMLTGKKPFESDFEQALIYEILNEDPRSVRSVRPQVPELVDQIVLKALAKDPSCRYQKAEDLLTDLKAARAPEAAGTIIAATEAIARTRKKKRVRLLIASGITLVVLAGLYFIGLPLVQDQAIASNPRAIAFVSFENKTGDPSLEYIHGVLPHALGTTLEDSEYLRVTGSNRMRELMRQIGKDTVEFIDRATGLLLCRMAGIDVVGVGSYTKAGPLFLTELELIDVKTGQRVGGVLKARGRGAESLLEQGGIVDELAKEVSRGMGVSQLRTRASVKPLAEVSSTSIEAQQYYQRGCEESARFNFKEARKYLEMAVREDSTFAIAWYSLFQACGALGDGAALNFAADQSVKNIARATEKEQFIIASLDTNLMIKLLKERGYEPDLSIQGVARARAEIFPFDPGFRLKYAGTLGFSEYVAELENVAKLDQAMPEVYNELSYAYARIWQTDKMTGALERYAELRPGDPNPQHTAAECLLMVHDYDKAFSKCEQALRLQPDFHLAAATMAKLHFMKEDYDEAMHWTDRGFAMAPSKNWQAEFLWWRAFYEVWTGRLKDAERTLQKSEKSTIPPYHDDHYGRISWLRGWIAYESGKVTEARTHLSSWQVYPYSTAFCLGLIDLKQGLIDSATHRIQRMKEVTQRASRRQPSNAQTYEAYLHFYGSALESALQLATNHPEGVRWGNYLPGSALPFGSGDSLVTVSWPMYQEYGFGGSGWGGISNLIWIPTPFDVVAQAYVARGLIDSAIASYEVALKKPPHPYGPIVPRCYYRLARLYEQKGLKAKAIENYALFLKVWGKADPVYKEPADARKRLARLKGTI